MMNSLGILILGLYIFVLGILSIYGIHRYRLVYLYTKHRNRLLTHKKALDSLPKITVQLPVFNEMYVVDRLINAVCQIDYPRELLEVQVLDDSTDETKEIALAAVRRHTLRGINISHHWRSERRGFKAGALNSGLKVAHGQFIAVFDADFVPPSDFLRRVISIFSDPSVGMVQTRWGHLNPDYSLLTKIQSIFLDGHFVVEHGSRSRSGLFFNFNGTAGVWRRDAILSAGGWQHDTLTEDLDLSYRAQLKGWKFVFLQALESPAELPIEMNAFKSQQYRWAKGSVQTFRKLFPRILNSQLPMRVRVEAFFHLSANFNYVLLLALSLLIFPAVYVRYNVGWHETHLLDSFLFCVVTLSIVNFYALCQRELYPDWLMRMKYLPALMGIGVGLCVNNTKAVFEGLFSSDTEFVRTPKYGIRYSKDSLVGKQYRQPMTLQPLIEIGLGLYFTATLVYALALRFYGIVPFLILFQFGFLYMGLMSLVQRYANGGFASRVYNASGK